ncbi:hypothetical protein DXA96_12200 [Lachnospiraceae bacterium OF09-33XD]|nr:hypothetical protein DXA96_12200 [Lachnospiraceae bacterium OF09-33XD]
MKKVKMAIGILLCSAWYLAAAADRGTVLRVHRGARLKVLGLLPLLRHQHPQHHHRQEKTAEKS